MFGKLREWSKGGVPAQYYLQLQHYLELTGATWGSFAVLFGGNRLVQFDVPRDDAIIQLIIDKARTFWEYVQADRMPPIPLTSVVNDELTKLFPTPTQATTLRLETPEAIGRARRLLRLKDRVATIKDELEQHEAWFKLQMADHAACVVPEIATIKWTPGEQRRIDLDALRQHEPVIAAAHTKVISTRRFSVTALEDQPEPEPDDTDDATPVTFTVSARRIELD
jgi:predicted phage-related endonuclease